MFSRRSGVVCITGDLTSYRSQFQRVLREVRRIRCPQILFVPGNYEREEAVGLGKRPISGPDYAAMMSQLAQTCIVLENRAALLRVGDHSLLVYGFDNSVYGNEAFDPKVMEVAHHFKLVLAHSPSIIRLLSQENIPFDLLLVGHTHGGQIRLFGRTVGPYRHFHVGLRKEQGGRFYINRGLGTTRVPIRLGSPPEVAVFDLH